MPRGAFQLTGDNENFDLRPADNLATAIPRDQRKVSLEVYEIRNILVLLKRCNRFANDEPTFQEFVNRLRQAATGGCCAVNVNPGLAEDALDQIRTDITRRVGRPTVYRNLCCFAGWCLAGVAVGLVAAYVAPVVAPSLTGYGWMIVGAMSGVWLSVAVKRNAISFDSILDYLDNRFEPFVRILFVGILAIVLGVLLQVGLLSTSVGGIALSGFTKDAFLAFALGSICGIGEKAISVKLMDRLRKVMVTG